MSEPHDDVLHKRRILLVEDEYIIAADVIQWLEGRGAEVIGPATTVSEALKLASNFAGKIDAALLDINVRGDRVYPVAQLLKANGVPFAFASGYDSLVIPPLFDSAHRFQKPIDYSKLIHWFGLVLCGSRPKASSTVTQPFEL